MNDLRFCNREKLLLICFMNFIFSHLQILNCQFEIHIYPNLEINETNQIKPNYDLFLPCLVWLYFRIFSNSYYTYVFAYFM